MTRINFLLVFTPSTLCRVLMENQFYNCFFPESKMNKFQRTFKFLGDLLFVIFRVHSHHISSYTKKIRRLLLPHHHHHHIRKSTKRSEKERLIINYNNEMEHGIACLKKLLSLRSFFTIFWFSSSSRLISFISSRSG